MRECEREEASEGMRHGGGYEWISERRREVASEVMNEGRTEGGYA